MSKKIIAFSLFLAMCLQNHALADIGLDNIAADREFSEDRSVYYIEIPDNEIPDIGMDGYELLHKASVPAVKEAKVIFDNVTVLENKETGKKYRFIFEKNEKSRISVGSVSISAAGKLTVSGEVSGNDILKVIILKPEEEYSERSVRWEELKKGELEKGILDIIEVDSGDIKDGLILEYPFPSSAVSGNYGVLITGDNSEESYYNDSVFYMSEKDLEKIINGLSEICKKDITDENISELIRYINDNEKNLYLDLSDFKKLTEKAQKKAAELMFSEKGYADADAAGAALYKAVTVVWSGDGKDLSDILDKYDEYFAPLLIDGYKEIDSYDLINEYVKKSISEEDFIKKFNTAAAISMINVSDTEKIAAIMKDKKEYLSLSENVYNAYTENEDICIRALSNKGFKSVEEIEKAITDAVKKKTDNKNSSGGSSSASSGGGRSGGGYTVPSITPVIEPEEEKIEENKLPFDDLDNYEWAKNAIEHMYINKIINGRSETKFAPKDNIKREEFVKIIVNGFEFMDSKPTGFADVGEEWYKEFIERGYASGIINGISDEMFGIGNNITREDMAVIIYRAVLKKGLELDIEIAAKADISDLDEISDYAKEAVSYLISKGAIRGSGGRFYPKNHATRAEAAQMIYNVIKIR